MIYISRAVLPSAFAVTDDVDWEAYDSLQ